MPLGGYSFDPAGGGDQPQQGGAGGVGPVTPQDAIRILSLRMPQQGRSPIPWQLLMSKGGQNPLAAVIQALMQGQGGGMDTPGQPPTPRVIPGTDYIPPGSGPVETQPQAHPPNVPNDFPFPPGSKPEQDMPGMPGSGTMDWMSEFMKRVPGGGINGGRQGMPQGIAMGEPNGSSPFPMPQQMPNRRGPGQPLPGQAPPLF